MTVFVTRSNGLQRVQLPEGASVAILRTHLALRATDVVISDDMVLRDDFRLHDCDHLLVAPAARAGGITWTDIEALIGAANLGVEVARLVSSLVHKHRAQLDARPAEGAWDISAAVVQHRKWAASDFAGTVNIPVDTARGFLRAYGFKYNRRSRQYEVQPHGTLFEVIREHMRVEYNRLLC